MNAEVANILLHYGKKGMRWGVRTGGSGSSGGSSGKRSSGGSSSKKSGGKSSGKSAGGGRTTFHKPASKLTDAQLSQRIKRIEMEKKYNDLKKPEVGKGKKTAHEILGNVGKQVATAVLVGATMYAISAAIGKASKNSSLAKGITGKEVKPKTDQFGNLFGGSKKISTIKPEIGQQKLF